MEKSKTFYEMIALLFYAIAMVDRQMTREEKLKIIAFTKQYWTTTIQDLNTQEFIYSNLREYIKDKKTSKSAYDSFKAYFLNHREEFNETTKSQLLESCDAIAKSFGKRNKSELIMLNNLALMFKD